MCIAALKKGKMEVEVRDVLKKKEGQDRNPAHFNPISYEKPTIQTAGKCLSLHGFQKIGPNRHQGRFNPIFYENQLEGFKFFAKAYHSFLKPFW